MIIFDFIFAFYYFHIFYENLYYVQHSVKQYVRLPVIVMLLNSILFIASNYQETITINTCMTMTSLVLYYLLYYNITSKNNNMWYSYLIEIIFIAGYILFFHILDYIHTISLNFFFVVLILNALKLIVVQTYILKNIKREADLKYIDPTVRRWDRPVLESEYRQTNIFVDQLQDYFNIFNIIVGVFIILTLLISIYTNQNALYLTNYILILYSQQYNMLDNYDKKYEFYCSQEYGDQFLTPSIQKIFL